MQHKFHPALAIAAAAIVAAGCASFDETLAKADGGDASAMYSVGKAYAKGDGTDRNAAKAEEYFVRAADLGNEKARRALLLLWLETGNTEKHSAIMEQLPKCAKGSIFSYGLDADLLECAPEYAKALAKKIVEGDRRSESEFVEFDNAVVAAEFELFENFRAGGAAGPGFDDIPDVASYRSLMRAIATHVDRERTRRARETAEAERKAKEEEERIARETAEAERKAREEAERIAREKAEAERKAEEEAAEREWVARKDDVGYKFPLHDAFPDSMSVYKELRTGMPLGWCERYLSHAGFSVEKGLASDAENYYNPTNVAFQDGSRIVRLDFGAVPPENRPVLVGGRIKFDKEDISAETLVEKYRKELPTAEFSKTEEEVSDGGGMLFGLPVPRITWKNSVVSFSTKNGQATVRATEKVSLVMGAHRVDENGNYKGPAGEIMADTLRKGYSFRGGQLDMELAGKAIDIWKDEHEKCGVPLVEITDTALRDATVAAFEKEKALQLEREKERAAEAERKRREEEMERANSF